MPDYDATFAPGGPPLHDLTTAGTPGLWQDPAAKWSVAGSTLTGLPDGPNASFLVRPAGELSSSAWPAPGWGQGHSIVVTTPDGGWGATSPAWGLVACWSMPGTDPAQASYYSLVARPSTSSGTPGSLTISKVVAGGSTPLGPSVPWTTDSSKSYCMVFGAGQRLDKRPDALRSYVGLSATVFDRASAPPFNMMAADTATHAYRVKADPDGPYSYTEVDTTEAYVTSLSRFDVGGLRLLLAGVPGLMALPSTDGAPFTRVRLDRAGFLGFGPRAVGIGFRQKGDGTLEVDPTVPGAVVLPV